MNIVANSESSIYSSLRFFFRDKKALQRVEAARVLAGGDPILHLFDGHIVGFFVPAQSTDGVKRVHRLKGTDESKTMAIVSPFGELNNTINSSVLGEQARKIIDGDPQHVSKHISLMALFRYPTSSQLPNNVVQDGMAQAIFMDGEGDFEEIYEEAKVRTSLGRHMVACSSANLHGRAEFTNLHLARQFFPDVYTYDSGRQSVGGGSFPIVNLGDLSVIRQGWPHTDYLSAATGVGLHEDDRTKKPVHARPHAPEYFAHLRGPKVRQAILLFNQGYNGDEIRRELNSR